jgi:hypothetical protein
MLILVIVIILIAVAYFMYQADKNSVPEFIHDHWSHYIPDLQFSSKEFYQSVEELLTKREIPDAKYFQVEMSERGSIMDRHRLYLRVKNTPYSFDICAAPYGTGFFVSWWFGEDIGCLMRILFYIPLLGSYLKKRMYTKTYYIMDTEDMFMTAIHYAVTQCLDAVTTQKGLRVLNETERQVPRGRRIQS